MSFWNDILELRRQELIPRQWRREHIIPYLEGKYRPNTIWTVPSNQSVSKDGRIRGNYVQRGMAPKAYRIAPGLFELIDELTQRPEPSGRESVKRRRRRSHSPSSKVVSSAKSRNIRLPGEIVQEYGLSGPLVLEKSPQGLLLRKKKLSWEETAVQMAQEAEDWSPFEVTIADGLNGDS
jgi:hypothetical protein